MRLVLECDSRRGGQRGVRHCVRWVLGCDSLRDGRSGVTVRGLGWAERCDTPCDMGVRMCCVRWLLLLRCDSL